MMVFRSPCRPRVNPLRRDPFEGALRVALGRAKARREPVTLARISETSTRPDEAAPAVEIRDRRSA